MSKKVNYKAWEINARDYPSSGSLEDKIRFLSVYGALAPSTHNTQPWLFEYAKDSLIIKPDLSKQLKIGDPNNWGLYISIGACTENIMQAAQAHGLSTDVNITEGLINLKFSDKPISGTDINKLKAIINRHSAKLLHTNRPLSNADRKELRGHTTKSWKIHIVIEGEKRAQIINNHIESARMIAGDPQFAKELSLWLRSNHTGAVDGMPGFTSGNSSLKTLIGKILIRKKPQLLIKTVGHDRKLLESSAGYIIFTLHDKITPTSLIEGGRLIEKIWLDLIRRGYSAHPMFAAIQDNNGRNRLAKILETDGTPLFFMRFGVQRQQFKTPRRL